MKTIIYVILTVASFQAFAGHETGSGGDAVALEFVSVAREVYALLELHPMLEVSSSQLKVAIQNTKVVSEESLKLEGREVDAINYRLASPPRIEVSRKRWKESEKVPYKRVFIVFHEYLGILGIDDTKYAISSLLDDACVCTRSAKVRESLEWQLGKSCYRIRRDDLFYIRSLELKNANEIKTGDLRFLTNLSHFYLFSQNLLSVPAGIFIDTPNLKDLTLFTRNLQPTAGLFSGLGGVNHLDLFISGDTLLGTILDGIVDNPDLELQLKLDNVFSSIDPTFLSHIGNRKEVTLDLSNWEYTHLAFPATFFTNFHSPSTTLVLFDRVLPEHIEEINTNPDIIKLKLYNGATWQLSGHSPNFPPGPNQEPSLKGFSCTDTYPTICTRLKD